MKSYFIKLLLLICTIPILCSLTVRKAEANAPGVAGTVLTAKTNAPVAGVWVKWTPTTPEGIYRYAQTDTKGAFYFPSIGNMSASQIQTLENTSIDTNNDGKNDSPELYAPGYTIASIQQNFSCGDNPQTFTVITPIGTNGTFSQVTGVKVNNGNDTVNLRNIIFTPAVPAPTPTPVPVTFTISGNVFVDANKNELKDTNESNYTNNFSISISPNAGTITTNANGSYTISNLPAGIYTVSYLSLPNGYNMTTPLNGPPPSYKVTVGAGICTTNGAPGATCQ